MADQVIFGLWAPQFAQLGFQVFPLRPYAKEPFGDTNGCHAASNDPKLIAEWARNYPANSNIGLVGGPNSGELGLMIIDVDAHHGGIETMKWLTERYGPLPKGPRSRTPNGGIHLFFAYDKRVGNTVNTVGKGIDTKSAGGYVVAPPSVWDGMKRGELVLSGGGAYRWSTAPAGSHLPLAPEWFIKRLQPRPMARPGGGGKTPEQKASLAEVENVIECIGNHDYWTWVKVGMALKAEFGDAGYDLWHKWSSSGYSGFKPNECVVKWRSFKRNNGVNIGSVFYEARKAGADLRADRSVR